MPTKSENREYWQVRHLLASRSVRVLSEQYGKKEEALREAANGSKRQAVLESAAWRYVTDGDGVDKCLGAIRYKGGRIVEKLGNTA